MLISKIKGFKYPDAELVRWFFKNKIYEISTKKVLEFGSHNGNNLALFASYDYECLGVDLSKENIKNANFNFKELFKYKKCKFFIDDIKNFAKEKSDIKASVFLIPNVINFLTKNEFITLLKNARQNKLYSYGGGDEKNVYSHFFLRARSVKDYRYGLGKSLENGSFLLVDDEYTGEKGCICTAYQEYELVELLKKYLNLFDFELITSENINVKNKKLIKDSDIIIYGKIC